MTYLDIAEDGTFTPTLLELTPGTHLTVRTRDVDAVLCIDSASVFGALRYEIPALTERDLTVQLGAPDTFDFRIAVGDLSQSCTGTRAATGEGAGKVSGGPGRT